MVKGEIEQPKDFLILLFANRITVRACPSQRKQVFWRIGRVYGSGHVEDMIAPFGRLLPGQEMRMDIRQHEIHTTPSDVILISLARISVSVLSQLAVQLGLLCSRLVVGSVHFSLDIRCWAACAGAEIDESVDLEVGGAQDGLEGSSDKGGGRGGLKKGGLEFPNFG